MDRRVLLMRHAKSAWDTDAPDDHRRPLNKRGRRDAPKVAESIQRLGWIPEIVLSSDALRTRQTMELMLPVLSPPPEVRYVPGLYLAGLEAVQSVVCSVPAEARTLLLLGHNPGWEEVLLWMSGRQEALKTASVALLAGRALDWAQAFGAPGRFKLEALLRAREL